MKWLACRQARFARGATRNLDAPEFSKFVAEDFCAADRGGEENRQG
jgi:hypothetical protein